LYTNGFWRIVSLREAGVETIHSHYSTMIHGFVTMDELFGKADDALLEASDALKRPFY
jgi:acetyl esterase/lipase